MFGFLKRLFGFDKDTMKDAKKENDDVGAPDWLRDSHPHSTGIEVKEIVPVTAAEVVVINKDPEPTPAPKPPVVSEPVKPAAMTPKKKSQGQKKPQAEKSAPKSAPKPAQGKQPARRGRKPKSQ